MGGVLDGARSVLDSDSSSEFLMGRTGGTAIPLPNVDGGAGQRIGICLEKFGARADGGVDVVGGEINRLATLIKISDLTN